VFNLFTVTLTELTEIIDNASIPPMKDVEAFDDNGVSDELLLSAVKEYENQQVVEADQIDQARSQDFSLGGVLNHGETPLSCHCQKS
jgi:hypothetical protein